MRLARAQAERHGLYYELFKLTSLSIKSPIRTVIVSHMDVCKNTFTYHLSDKTHGF